MRSNGPWRTRTSVRTGLVATALFLGAGTARASNVVVDWNQIAIGAVTTAGQGPLPQTRTMAIVHAAVHDAINGVTGEYEPYAVDVPCPSGASAQAAGVAAAHFALAHLFPAQTAALDAAYAASLSAYGLSPSDTGIALGETVAARILELRAGDHAAEAQFPYSAPGAGNIGVWVPTPPAFAPALLPGWVRVTPWVIRTGSQFRPEEGPPAVDSERYATDYEEVKDLGAVASATRTPEQTNIARFWLASAAVIWNGVLRQVAPARGLSLSQTAHVFALLNLAGADAAIACYDAKYAFNFWRPVTAIQRGDADGNDGTTGDPIWAPLVPTPPFPEFPSGHTTISEAMAFVLRQTFGDDPGVTFTGFSPTNPGFVRHWTAFSQGVDEVIDARVFSGIHFRNSDVVGARMGRQVGRFVTKHGLRSHRGDDRDNRAHRD